VQLRKKSKQERGLSAEAQRLTLRMRCLSPWIENVFHPWWRVGAIFLAWFVVNEGPTYGQLAADESDPLNSSPGSAGPDLLPRVDELPARTPVVPKRRSHSLASNHRSKLWRVQRASAHSRTHRRHRHLVAMTAGRHRFGAHAGHTSNQPLRRRAKQKSALQTVRAHRRHSAHARHLHSRWASRAGLARRHPIHRRSGSTQTRKRVRVFAD
jgi:hypothetical protein